MSPSWQLTLALDPLPPLNPNPYTYPGLLWGVDARQGLYRDAALTTPVTASGQGVGGWTAQGVPGPALKQASAPSQPAYQAAGLNGHPAVVWAGAYQLLISAAETWGIGTGDYYLALVAGTSGSVSGTYPALTIDGAAPGLYVIAGEWTYQDGALTLGLGPAAPSTAYLVEVWRQSGVLYSAIDGVAGPSAASAAAVPSSYLIMGNDAALDFWVGPISAGLLFGRALAPVERAAAEAYLMAQWGIP
jgi:hypothetical protein